MSISDEYRESIRIRCELILAHLDNASLQLRALSRCNVLTSNALSVLKTNLEQPVLDQAKGTYHE